ncbi:hypothetical protein [Cupriavidus basilensis]|uniref:hypothetical protein n=1 Tax=Cupriavidus basilensis TaxID=68895 RepID=UPI0039F6B567
MKRTDSICVEIRISPNDGPLHNRLKQYPSYAGSRERAQYVKSLLIRAFETLEQAQYGTDSAAHSPVAGRQTASTIGKHDF